MSRDLAVVLFSAVLARSSVVTQGERTRLWNVRVSDAPVPEGDLAALPVDGELLVASLPSAERDGGSETYVGQQLVTM